MQVECIAAAQEKVLVVKSRYLEAIIPQAASQERPERLCDILFVAELCNVCEADELLCLLRCLLHNLRPKLVLNCWMLPTSDGGLSKLSGLTTLYWVCLLTGGRPSVFLKRSTLQPSCFEIKPNWQPGILLARRTICAAGMQLWDLQGSESCRASDISYKNMTRSGSIPHRVPPLPQRQGHVWNRYSLKMTTGEERLKASIVDIRKLLRSHHPIKSMKWAHVQKLRPLSPVN